MKRLLSMTLVLTSSALAWAQPTPPQAGPPPGEPTPPTGRPAAPTDRPAPLFGEESAPAVPPTSDETAPVPAAPAEAAEAAAPLFTYPPADPASSGPKPPRPPPKPPEGLLFAPTARMLDAGEISSASALDTIGGAQLELKIGLGGVAEFGIGSTDHVRIRDCADCDARAVRFVPMARFVMGLPEHRMFRNQPALALGFQKSFSRSHDNRSSRYASLYMVASKRLGTANVHAGVMLWDGVIQRADDSEVALHDGPVDKMLRPYGGVEVLARSRSHVIIDLTWNPELEVSPELASPDSIRLRPMLSWGVRYAASPRVALEAGVRVPDIGDANLLDAQIFAQLRFTSRAIANAIEDLQGN